MTAASMSVPVLTAVLTVVLGAFMAFAFIVGHNRIALLFLGLLSLVFAIPFVLHYL